MRRPRDVWPVIRRVWITVGLTATAVFVAWSLAAYRASAFATSAAQGDGAVQVSRTDGVWTFAPRRTAASDRVLVFFPGALVDPRAYAPLAQHVARKGFRALIIELPRRGAFGGAESPGLRLRIQRTFAGLDDSASVILAGHSRGAVVASTVAAERRHAIDGLVLIGSSHPRDVDLSRLAIPVTKIVGTRDGLASPDEVRQNAHLLPAHTRWIWIEGGNHSQFGWYGFQPMDQRARIPAAQQRNIMAQGVLDLLQDRGAVSQRS